MQDFRKLTVWKRSHELTLRLYELTATFPRGEVYGLTSQIKRSAASVPTNIAEGCGREGGADFARFLQIAFGSASELEYQLLLAHDLGFLGDGVHEETEREVTEIKRMLTSLIQRVRSSSFRISDGVGPEYELTTDY
jgi:four helix bundle protein